MIFVNAKVKNVRLGRYDDFFLSEKSHMFLKYSILNPPQKGKKIGDEVWNGGNE